LDFALRRSGHYCVAPQNLAEFLAVVSDARRFPRALSPSQAAERAVRLWRSRTLHKILTLLDEQGFEYVVNAFDRITNPSAHPPFRLDTDTRYLLLVYGRQRVGRPRDPVEAEP
jgi:hypothetical protein